MKDDIAQLAQAFYPNWLKSVAPTGLSVFATGLSVVLGILNRGSFGRVIP